LLGQLGGIVSREVNVTDFKAGSGGDIYNFESILNSNVSGFDGSTNPFGTFVRLLQDGDDTLFQFDADGGSGPESFVTLTRLQYTTVTDFTFENFDPGYSPDGGPTPGIVLTGTPVDDILTGGVGNDILNGLEEGDVLDGDAGDDEINGGAGNDVLRGGFGDDIINGGDDNDTINGDAGDDRLNGGDGNDVIRGGAGSNFIDGGRGNDSLTGGSGSDIIFGREGDDRIVGSGDDVVDAGSGDDFITFSGNPFGLIGEITLGDGRDILEVRRTDTSVPVVTDFQAGPGGDVLDLDLITTSSLNYDGFANLFAEGYLRLVAENGGTFVEYDRDASGSAFNFGRLVFLLRALLMVLLMPIWIMTVI